jgi:ribosome-associated protein
MLIDEKDLRFHFVRSSGPGGQNVNKVSTAVQVEFDVASSTQLSDHVKRRLLHLAGRRATREGIIIIRAQRYRTQEQNRADALVRLQALVEAAAVLPKPRTGTRPTNASRKRRMVSKRQRQQTKNLRRKVDALSDDD